MSATQELLDTLYRPGIPHEPNYVEYAGQHPARPCDRRGPVRPGQWSPCQHPERPWTPTGTVHAAPTECRRCRIPWVARALEEPDEITTVIGTFAAILGVPPGTHVPHRQAITALADWLPDTDPDKPHLVRLAIRLAQ